MTDSLDADADAEREPTKFAKAAKSAKPVKAKKPANAPAATTSAPAPAPLSASANWLQVFRTFISLLRIDSKEIAATDSRGSELNLWRSQEIFLEELCKGLDEGVRRFQVLKARQLGVTTISLAIDVFWMAMYPGTIGALVTDTQANREANRALLKRYIESFPEGFFGKGFEIEHNNSLFMKFSNGSRLDFLVAGTRKKAAWGEGKGYVMAHLTEIASYGSKEGLDSFLEALAQTHPHRLLIIEGTAKGYNHWNEMWEAGKKDYFRNRNIFLGWWSNPLNTLARTDPAFALYGREPPSGDEERLIEMVETAYGTKVSQEQLAWYRQKINSGAADVSTVHQNNPWTESQAFVAGGFSFFQVRVLDKDLERICNPDNPVLYAGYRYVLGNEFHLGVMEPLTEGRADEVQLRVWEDPAPDGVYVIGCDPAWGRNEHRDRHAISVWRCFADRLVQVAEYADADCENRQAAWVLAHLAGSYRNSMINLELTGGPGRAVMSELENLRARMRSDMYRDKASPDYPWDEFLQSARWYLYHKCDSSGGGFPKGWETTGSNKWELMMQLRDSHSTGMALLRSRPLVEEMLNVVQDGNEIGAAGVGKDDRMFAAALANRAWIDWIRNGMIQAGMTYDAVMAEESGEPSSDGQRIVNRIVQNFLKRQDEREVVPTPQQQWMQERGFVL